MVTSAGVMVMVVVYMVVVVVVDEPWGDDGQ